MSGFEFLFYTDVHIQPERRAREGFAQAVDAMREAAPDAAFALCGGDIVLDANAVPYERASALYDLYWTHAQRLGLPIHHALGNHDFWGLKAASGADPDDPHWGRQLFREKLGQAQTFYSFDHGGWHFVILDTNDFLPDRTWHGRLDDTQCVWLADDLQNTGTEAPVVIVSHFPLLSAFGQYVLGSTQPTPDALIVANGKEVLELIRPFNVKVVLSGHTHSVEEITYLGTRHISGGSVCGEWWRGPRLGLHPEGFAICTAHADGEFSYRYVPYGWVAEEKPPSPQ